MIKQKLQKKKPEICDVEIYEEYEWGKKKAM